jgi:hypothetical protein
MKSSMNPFRADADRVLFTTVAFVAAVMLATLPVCGDVIYRETLGRPADTGDLSPTTMGWQSFSNVVLSTVSLVGINGSQDGRPTTVTNVNAGLNSDGTSGAYPRGIHYYLVGAGTKILTFTPEFNFDPASYVANSLVFSWYQGNQDTVDTMRLAIRIGSQWYASATTFANNASVSLAAFDTSAELKQLTFNPAKANWLLLNFDGDYDGGNPGTSTSSSVPLSLGAAPSSNLSGTITAFGIYVAGETDTRRWDTFQIDGTLTPGDINVSPASYSFDALATGTAAQTTFVVTNLGATAVSNGTVTVTGPYKILSGATFSIPGFGTTNVVVLFAPVALGGFTNNVIFTSANGGNSTNAVNGTGLAAGNTSGSQQLRPVSLGWVDPACQLALTYDDGGSPDYSPYRLSVTNFGSGVSFVAGHVNFTGSGTRRENIVSARTFSSSFTIAVWVRWTAGTGWQAIVDDTTTTHGLFVNPPQYVYDNADDNSSTATIVSNAWTFVAVVVTNYASNSAVQFWINGSKDAVYTNATKVSWAPAFIGSDTGSQAWIGDIDDVFIFRRALSDIEIPMLYEATRTDPR